MPNWFMGLLALAGSWQVDKLLRVYHLTARDRPHLLLSKQLALLPDAPCAISHAALHDPTAQGWSGGQSLQHAIEGHEVIGWHAPLFEPKSLPGEASR